MEKYGVKTHQSVKVASQGCPICGSKIETHGDVCMCPKHGTEPFENEVHQTKQDTSDSNLRSVTTTSERK